jgi:hypothetical protein
LVPVGPAVVDDNVSGANGIAFNTYDPIAGEATVLATVDELPGQIVAGEAFTLT